MSDSDSDDPVAPSPLSKYELQRQETMRANELVLAGLGMSSSGKEKTPPSAGQEDEEAIVDTTESRFEPKARKTSQTPKPRYRDHSPMPALYAKPSRKSAYQGGYKYSKDSDVPLRSDEKSRPKSPQLVQNKKKKQKTSYCSADENDGDSDYDFRKDIDFDGDFEEEFESKFSDDLDIPIGEYSGHLGYGLGERFDGRFGDRIGNRYGTRIGNRIGNRIGDYFDSDEHVAGIVPAKKTGYKVLSSTGRQIQVHNARIKMRRIKRIEVVSDAQPLSISPPHTIFNRDLKNKVQASEFEYGKKPFRDLDVSAPPDDVSDALSVLHSETPSHFDIFVYRMGNDRIVESNAYYQTEMSSYIQEESGVMLLVDENYSRLGYCEVVDRFQTEKYLYIRVESTPPDIKISKSLINFHQVYNTLISPKNAIAYACNTDVHTRIVPVLFDSEGHEIVGAFISKEFNSRTLMFESASMRLEHAQTLGRGTDEHAQLRFELQRNGMCVAWKNFPIVLCNSLHYVDNKIKNEEVKRAIKLCRKTGADVSRIMEEKARASEAGAVSALVSL